MPISVALVNDYEIILRGLEAMLEPFPELEIREIDIQTLPEQPVDVVLLSTFGQGIELLDHARALVEAAEVGRVVLYTWAFDDAIIETAAAIGVNGFVSKASSAEALVEAITRVHQGEFVVSDSPSQSQQSSGAEVQWPGIHAGLTERESEVLALLVRGFTNKEIGESLYLGMNSVKTHVRHIFEKTGANSRSKVVVWALGNGFRSRSQLEWSESSG